MFRFGNWTVGRRLVAGFGLSAMVLIAVAVVSYRNAHLLIENDGWVEHSHQVRIEFSGLLSDMKDAETGQRGYLLTGDENYLAPYSAAQGSIQSTLADLRKLTADNPNQQQRLANLSKTIDGKMVELKQTIDLRRAQGFDAALKVVLTNAGKVYMDEARAIVGEADQEERNLLKQRTEDARASAEMTMSIILWGGLFGTFAVIAIGWLISRSLANQIGSAVGQVRSSSTELQAAANQQASGPRSRPPPWRKLQPRSASFWRHRARSPRARSEWRTMRRKRRRLPAPVTARWT
jgi:CHASE3 domain sensor protein